MSGQLGGIANDTITGAALDANNPAPSDTESDTGPGAGQPLDWDEETDLIMSAIARARPQPLLTRPLISIKSKYQYVRMKEVLHNALDGSRGGSLFATRPQGPVTEGVEQGAAAAGGGLEGEVEGEQEELGIWQARTSMGL